MLPKEAKRWIATSPQAKTTEAATTFAHDEITERNVKEDDEN